MVSHSMCLPLSVRWSLDPRHESPLNNIPPLVALAHEAHEDGGKAGTTDPSYTTVTFLDTPGHAAFTAIRGRGAAATDMAVIVVAADDGPMPQTLESLEMTRRAGVPVIIAINKVDKAPDNVETVRLALMAEGVELETYGGDTQCVEISAIKVVTDTRYTTGPDPVTM